MARQRPDAQSRHHVIGSAVTWTLTGCFVVGNIVSAAVMVAHDPHNEVLIPQCAFFSATGWLCPGCGGLRAFSSLLHGDVMQSVAENPVVVMTYLSVILLAFGTSTPGTGTRHSVWRMSLAPVYCALIYSGLVRNLLPDLSPL